MVIFRRAADDDAIEEEGHSIEDIHLWGNSCWAEEPQGDDSTPHDKNMPEQAQVHGAEGSWEHHDGLAGPCDVVHDGLRDTQEELRKRELAVENECSS